MNEARAGSRRLLAALVAGLALVGALVALQLVDDGSDASDAPVRVKGAAVSRASLEGTVLGAERWDVEITVTVGAQSQTTAADDTGAYRFRDLPPGVAEVLWSGDSTATVGDITVGGQRTGRTQITLAPGRNVHDIAL